MTSARLAPDRLNQLVTLLREQVGGIEQMINPLESTVRHGRGGA
jgi:hypothetical protein